MVVRYSGKNKSEIKARLLNFGDETRSDFFIDMFCNIYFDLNSHTVVKDPAQLQSGLPCTASLAYTSRLSGSIMEVHVSCSLASWAVLHCVSDLPFPVDHFGKPGLAWILRD